MGYPDTLGIILVFTVVGLLVGTSILTKLLIRLPSAEMYLRLQSHYTNQCMIFTTPPPSYENYGGINKVYGKGRLNSLIFEYIMFSIMIVFIIFAIVSFLLSYDILGSWLESTRGIIINPVVGIEIFHFVMQTPAEGIIFFILAPQFVINPYFNYLLMKVQFFSQKSPALRDGVKLNSLTDYMSMEGFWRNFIYGTSSIASFYFGAKIILLIILGMAFMVEQSDLIMGVCLAFSITFMVTCRSISLEEMFQKTK